MAVGRQGHANWKGTDMTERIDRYKLLRAPDVDELMRQINEHGGECISFLWQHPDRHGVFGWIAVMDNIEVIVI